MIDEIKNQIRQIYVCDACTCNHACIFGGGKHMPNELCDCDAYEEYKKLDITMDNSMFVQAGKITGVVFNKQNYENKVELQLGDYELITENGKTYAKLKEEALYPTSYKECCKILGCDETPVGLFLKERSVGHEKFLYSDELNALFRLLVCRDAYWKIAGEQIGLRKPWQPNWADDGSVKHCIIVDSNIISKQNFYNRQSILSFPTKEIRDAFYNNFKDDIDKCVMLL